MNTITQLQGWESGLVVMGGVSCSEGCGFKTRTFFTYICCKNCDDVSLKKTKNKR